MAKRKIVCIDEEKCNGCGQCVNACAEGAIELHGDKARLVAEKYCDGLAACLGTCPAGCHFDNRRGKQMTSIPKQSKHICRKKGLQKNARTPRSTVSQDQAMPCGCPSANIQMFDRPTPSPGETGNAPLPRHGSELTHWPVQIKLIPPTAPFLKNADLLVASDCTPAAYPAFHERPP